MLKKGRSRLNVVLLGAPGAGKGTQAQNIKDKYKIPHIATGDILRASVAAGTEVGLRAKAYMDKGELVPDEVVVPIVAERIAQDDCLDGWLLDGFPRTVPQAEALDKTIENKSLKPIDRVVYLSVSAETVIGRLGGRRVCPNTDCGAAYHVEFMPPKAEGVCDRCGTKIVQRDDDKPETVRQRLDTFEKRTSALVNRYREAGVLVEIQAEGTPEEVGKLVLAELESVQS
jgi:adenylate kinase